MYFFGRFFFWISPWVGVATLPKSGRVVGVLVASAPLSLRQGDAWGGAP